MMTKVQIDGVVEEGNRLFTVVPNQYPAESIYGEKIIRKGNRILRGWNPYRSKLAASLLRNISLTISSKNIVLYLGAATGTTVSHLSDILTEGTVYAVEVSSFAMQKLLELCKERTNIVPILADASHPEKYQHLVPTADIVYQDIAQRNQVDIFIENCNRYLKENGYGVIMVKARSVDVTSEPNKIYEKVKQQLQEHGYKIIDYKKLDPYARDHSVIVVTR
ncbi:MAG TPA: fibrillarin-like rRNA/tRNA 2'-O-methyltransferase, partial [Thermoplasmatales archaeon]|nr:fibrillarin-like rRNA/tRNA 2'-O-methyltransferase [Thermoplasmatales archaeon]